MVVVIFFGDFSNFSALLMGDDFLSIIEWFLAPRFLSTCLGMYNLPFYQPAFWKLHNCIIFTPNVKFTIFAHWRTADFNHAIISMWNVYHFMSRNRDFFLFCLLFFSLLVIAWIVLAFFCFIYWFEMQGANEKSHLAVKFQLDEYLIYSLMLANIKCAKQSFFFAKPFCIFEKCKGWTSLNVFIFSIFKYFCSKYVNGFIVQLKRINDLSPVIFFYCLFEFVILYLM